MVFLTIEEAAVLTDVKPVQLKVWLETEKFQTSTVAKTALGEKTYYFNEYDIERLSEFAAGQQKRKFKITKSEPFVDDGQQETFTVAEIASMWRLSTDTVQRLFEDEADVVVIGNKNPRGKRRRITLRIPRDVMERVKRRRSNT